MAYTGGYMYGGYQHESERFGILEVSFPEGGPRGRWVCTGEMTARSNSGSGHCIHGSNGQHRLYFGCILGFGDPVAALDPQTLDASSGQPPEAAGERGEARDIHPSINSAHPEIRGIATSEVRH